MSSIYLLVHKTFEAGYLSLETETQLQTLLSTGSDLDDMDLMMLLKQAIAFGHVRRQANELKRAA